MLTSKRKKSSIVVMAELAILTAIVIVIQLLGVGIKLPFLSTPVSLVLVPIALGAIVIGPVAGAWLGFVMGAIVFITCCLMGMDPMFTGVLFANNPIMTAIICLFKSTIAGFVGGIVYKALKKINPWVAIFSAAAVVPIVNTGLFILGCLAIYDTIAVNFATSSSVLYFLVIGCAGFNFIFEFLFNVLLAPALGRVVQVINKQRKR